MGSHVHRCLFFGNFRESNKLSSTSYNIFLQRVCDIDFIGNHHPHIAIDAAVVVEVHPFLRFPRRSQLIIFCRHSDSKDIGTFTVDTIGNICYKSHVASMVFGYLLTVEINLTISHYTFKLHHHALVSCLRGHLEVAAIPAHPIINGVSTTMLGFQLHDMGQADRHPSCNIGISRRTIFHISPEECPFGVHVNHLASVLICGASCATQAD